MAGSAAEITHPEAHVITDDQGLHSTLKPVASLELVPRSIKGLDRLTSPVKLRSDYLEDFIEATDAAARPLGADRGTLKALENRFYIDLAVEKGKKHYAHRKLTAIVPGATKPLKIRWELIEPAIKGIGGFGQNDSFKAKTESATTKEGLAETTLVLALEHYDPAAYTKEKPLKITVSATVVGSSGPDSSKSLSLTVWRNEFIDNLAQVYDKPDKTGKGDHLLTFQPAKQQETDAVLELNHCLNHVVSRHQDAKFDFIPQNGKYGKESKKAVESFVTAFPKVSDPDLWPYDLTNSGIYPSLKEYLNNEYGPFKYDANKGAVVDRHLLIGKELCSRDKFEPDKINGLYELKFAVVDRLLAAMRKRAKDYFDCNIPWLHRPYHVPYKHGDQTWAMVEAVESEVGIFESPGGAPKLDGGKKLVLWEQDRHIYVSSKTVDGATWYEIRLGGEAPNFVTGWVPGDKVSEVARVDISRKSADGKAATPDVYESPGGARMKTLGKDGEADFALRDDDRVKIIERKTIESNAWCKVPVRPTRYVWLKQSDINSKQQIVIGDDAIQLYDSDGEPVTAPQKDPKTGDDVEVPVTVSNSRSDYREAENLSVEGAKPDEPPAIFYKIPHKPGEAYVQAGDVTLVWVLPPKQPQHAPMYPNPEEKDALEDPYGNPLYFGAETQHTLYLGNNMEVEEELIVDDVRRFKVKSELTVAGWIKSDALNPDLTEDRPIDQDRGNYGATEDMGSSGYAVCYSFGCKNSPEEFRERMLGTFPADGGSTRHHRISAGEDETGNALRWDEYSVTQRVGLREAELFNPEKPETWAGIDCSGFVQNCVTYAAFEDGTRIVPRKLLDDLVHSGKDRGKYGRVNGTEVGASSAVGTYARWMKYSGTSQDDELMWVRGGDILTSKTHIVFVDGSADTVELQPAPPPKKSKKKSKSSDDEDEPPPPPPSGEVNPLQTEGTKKVVNAGRLWVLNAHGVDYGKPRTNFDPGAFTRKTIRMPLWWWTSIGNLKCGRVYIWCKPG